jgi:hypothetical protein
LVQPAQPAHSAKHLTRPTGRHTTTIGAVVNEQLLLYGGLAARQQRLADAPVWRCAGPVVSACNE